MTTVHHPPLKGVDFHHNLNWLRIGLSSILVVLVIGAIAWVMSTPSATETASVDAIVGFELDDDTSLARIIAPGAGVTIDIVGNIGELDPEMMTETTRSISGLELDDDTTLARIIAPGAGVTIDIVGNIGELDPEM